MLVLGGWQRVLSSQAHPDYSGAPLRQPRPAAPERGEGR